MKTALFVVVLALFLATGVITLLGLINKVHIEKQYLNKLFFALILELSGAVIYLFAGTDFYAAEAQEVVSPSQPLLSLASALNQRFPGETAASIEARLRLYDGIEQSLEQTQSELDDKNLEVTRLKVEQAQLSAEVNLRADQIKLLNNEMKARQEAMAKLVKLEKKFLVRMAELNSRISEWGSSINFRWQPDEKREVALMLQEAFKEIGFMETANLPNDDPMTTHDILVRYQKSKRFKEIGFLTPQVVAFIIQDYLSPGLVR
ncbi:hypothetical protein [Reinekea sp.]|jgi:hypothetical protein|uniref:hypothetical protein n=1 Tax=Reinekea sp. TaxID=1970455 RepID=UPI003989E17D